MPAYWRRPCIGGICYSAGGVCATGNDSAGPLTSQSAADARAPMARSTAFWIHIVLVASRSGYAPWHRSPPPARAEGNKSLHLFRNQLSRESFQWRFRFSLLTFSKPLLCQHSHISPPLAYSNKSALGAVPVVLTGCGQCTHRGSFMGRRHCRQLHYPPFALQLHGPGVHPYGLTPLKPK